MNCKAYEHIIKDAVAGEIDPEQQKRLHKHMAECAVCAETYSALMNTVEAAAINNPPQPSEHEWQVFRNNLKREINCEKAPAFVLFRRKLVPALALGAAVIAIAIIVLHQTGPKQETSWEQTDLWIEIEDELITELELEDLYAYDYDSSELDQQLEDLDLFL